MTANSPGDARAPVFFVFAALVSGIVFVFLTPPFQVPDEPGHFFRAFDLSEGSLLARNVDGRTGGELPASLGYLVSALVDDIAAHPENKIEPRSILASWEIDLEPENRVFTDFPTSAIYTPVPYLPQAIGVLFGRLLGGPPLLLVCLARLMNLVAATLLTYLGIRQLPAYRWLTVLFALSPMAIFQRASMSADATTTAMGFLLAGTIARLAFGEGKERINRRDLALVGFAACALCLCKPAYAPLALSPLLIPANRYANRTRVRVLTVLSLLVLCTFAVGVWTALSVQAPLRPDAGIDASAQVSGAIREPHRFFAIVLHDYVTHGPRFAAEAIGCLGWLDTPLPIPLLASFMILAASLVFVDASDHIGPARWQRLVLTLFVLLTLLMVSASQYAAWTPVGAPAIEGIQGRHFHPIIPLALWAFHFRRWPRSARDQRTTVFVCGYIGLVAAATALVVAMRYYL